MDRIAGIWERIQQHLLPGLRTCLYEPLSEREEQLASILEVARVEEHVPPSSWQRMGRRRADRRAIARAFVAKAVYGLATTKQLREALLSQCNLRRLCGWERRSQIPSEATFSRAFAEFAHTGLLDRVHEALVRQHVGDSVVMHIARDSTAIAAREKPVKKTRKPKPSASPSPVIRTKETTKGSKRKHLRRLDRQWDQSAQESLAELPTACDIGVCGKDGHKRKWVGYKAHMDCADGGLPISVVTTSASLHDSQVALPLAKLSGQRVTYLYELMDAAYHAYTIDQFSLAHGRVAIVDPQKAPGCEKTPLEPHQALRYRNRTTVERAFGRLKDEFGGRFLRVRGHAKVHCHIMFGVITLFADQLLKLLM